MRLIDADSLTIKIYPLDVEGDMWSVDVIDAVDVHNAPTIEAEAVPKWISVKDRLPESASPAYENDMRNAVLVYTPVDGYVHIGWYVRKDYRGRDVWHTLSAMRSHQTLTKKVSHWMPLPEPPKEDTP